MQGSPSTPLSMPRPEGPCTRLEDSSTLRLDHSKRARPLAGERKAMPEQGIGFRGLLWNSRLRALLLCLVLCTTLGATVAGAQTGSATAFSPPNANGYTDVEIGLYDVEILKIDPREETFEVEADLVAEWVDPRMAFSPNQVGTDALTFQDGAAIDALENRVWWPNFEITDARGARDRMHIDLTIYSDGSVFYRERMVVKIKQDFDLSGFPFDSHDISFRLESFSYDASLVRFAKSELGRSTVNWEPTEWTVSEPDFQVAPGLFCSDSGELCETDTDCPTAGETCDVGFAAAGINMSIARVPDHYMWKIILPLMLIVMASFGVFWLDLAKFPDPGDRLTIAFTGVLTVVAFDFVSAGSVPKLWYTTVMDRILILAYVFLALNILENVLAVSAFSKSESNGAKAARLDKIARWAFPPTFLFLALMLLMS